MAFPVKAECAGCLETFNGTDAFEAHRTGRGSTRRCMSVPEMTAAGFRQGVYDRWEAPPEANPRGS